MPFLTAEKIHNGYGWLPQGAVIEIDAKGTIVSILSGPHPDAVFHEGILAPGFVNAHCHLELSHMKGVVPEKTGLIPFLKKIPVHRNDFTDQQKTEARHNALLELLENGIVAVGDIANTTDTLDIRNQDLLHIHTFIESIGFNDDRAEKAFGYAVQAYDAFAGQQMRGRSLSQSIVPHAPYSVSKKLFGLIDSHIINSLISIHNQESKDEDLYFKLKEGGVGDLLHNLGIDDSKFLPTGKSSIQSYLEWVNQEHPFIFVHNTFTQKEDLQFAMNKVANAYWCLCPNANRYIENCLPDVPMLMAGNATICIGTDSLASNNQLCILSELFTLNEHFPAIGWETLLQWSTINGAKALNLEHITGSLEIGKIPGIIQIIGLNEAKPTVKRLI